MAVLGGYKLHVTSERENDDATLTSHPVEKGLEMTDHVENQPIKVELNGVIVGSDYQEIKKSLRKLKNEGKRITYVGRRSYNNLAIEALEFTASKKIKNGEEFTCTLKEIRIALETLQSSQNQNAGRQQLQNQPTERYHTIKPGDTYWGLAQVYKGTVQQMIEWNKWPPRSIPLNVKVRVE